MSKSIFFLSGTKIIIIVHSHAQQVSVTCMLLCVCIYPKIHDDERRPTARAQTYKSHKYDGTRTIASTDDTQKDTQHTHQIHDGKKTTGSAYKKRHKYDGTKITEGSDIQKDTKYTHQIHDRRKTTKSTYTKRLKYNGTRTIASTDIQKGTKYDGTRTIARAYTKKTSKYDGMRTTHKELRHIHTLKRHTHFIHVSVFLCSPMF